MPFPPSGDRPDPGIKSGSLALQDCLPSESPGKPRKRAERVQIRGDFSFCVNHGGQKSFSILNLGFIKGGLRASGRKARTFILDMFQQLPGHLGGPPGAGEAQAGPDLWAEVRAFYADGHGLAEGPQTMLSLHY